MDENCSSFLFCDSMDCRVRLEIRLCASKEASQPSSNFLPNMIGNELYGILCNDLFQVAHGNCIWQ